MEDEYDDIYNIYDWPITGVPSEFVFSEEEYINPDYSNERWKDTELPNIMVSNWGRFFNTKTRKIIEPTHGDAHGHKAVKTRHEGKRYQAYAHRLIAEAYVENPHNYPIVRHLDDVPDNNEIGNLAWGTARDNHLDAVRNGTYRPFSDADREKNLEKMRKPVRCVGRDGKIKNYRSLSEAAADLGIQQANAWKVAHGLRKHTCGYSFEFLRREEDHD